LAVDADLEKNLFGVDGWNSETGRNFCGWGGAGDPDNLTVLMDLLNALAIGVEDKTEAIEATLDIVFFFFDSTLGLANSLKFRELLFIMKTSPFFRFLFR
jgi:hypothetical protein